MTDLELIKRLHDFGHVDAYQAADRIEKLEHEVSSHKITISMMNFAWNQALQQRDEAEAKLAKAVEALEEIITRWDTPSWKDAEATGNVINRARTDFAAYPPEAFDTIYEEMKE